MPKSSNCQRLLETSKYTCDCHPEKDDKAEAGNRLQKNTSWLVTAESCYQRVRVDKAHVSWLTLKPPL